MELIKEQKIGNKVTQYIINAPGNETYFTDVRYEDKRGIIMACKQTKRNKEMITHPTKINEGFLENKPLAGGKEPLRKRRRESSVADEEQGMKRKRMRLISTNNAADPTVTEMNILRGICGEVRPLHALTDGVIKKLGEGSFGEVFMRETRRRRSIEKSVLKIVPIGGHEQTGYTDIISELKITKRVSHWGSIQDSSCVVQAKGFFLASGRVPVALCDLWDEWKSDAKNDCQNQDLRTYGENQHYVVFEFEFGGTPIEHFKFKNQSEVQSVVRQIILTLAKMEQDLRFEHRDLHLGNVLVMRKDNKGKMYGNRRISISDCGLKVTVIDFTLARCDGNEENDPPIFKDLSQEGWLFDGVGDEQFDVYRSIRRATANQWEGFRPKTNVLWVCYLLKDLMNSQRNHKRLSDILKAIKDCRSCVDMLKFF